MKRIIEFFVFLILISFGFTFCVKDDPPTVELGTSLNIVFPALPLPPLPPNTDRDGNTYKTIKIGNQIWMAENLRTTKYNDGTPIPNVTAWSEWSNLLTGAYCWYENEEYNYSDYGALYNGFTIRTGKLCPVGWHVPGLSDWTTLITYLGGWDVAGGKLKEAGTGHWEDPNTGATNESGFTALPGGHHVDYWFPGWHIFCHWETPFFGGIGLYSEWWSSTADTYLPCALVYLGICSSEERVFGLNTPSRFIEYGNDIEYGREILNGCYVRCIKDN